LIQARRFILETETVNDAHLNMVTEALKKAGVEV